MNRAGFAKDLAVIGDRIDDEIEQKVAERVEQGDSLYIIEDNLKFDGVER